MKVILCFFSLIFFLVSSKVFALEKGKWNFVKTDEYCYVGTLAIETDLSPEKNRGEFYILVYKNIGSPDAIVQIEAGYDYKIGPEINVKIDKGNYIFYTGVGYTPAITLSHPIILGPGQQISLNGVINGYITPSNYFTD